MERSYYERNCAWGYQFGGTKVNLCASSVFYTPPDVSWSGGILHYLRTVSKASYSVLLKRLEPGFLPSPRHAAIHPVFPKHCPCAARHLLRCWRHCAEWNLPHCCPHRGHRHLEKADVKESAAGVKVMQQGKNRVSGAQFSTTGRRHMGCPSSESAAQAKA